MKALPHLLSPKIIRSAQVKVAETGLSFAVPGSPSDSYQQSSLLSPGPGNISPDVRYVRVQPGGCVRPPGQPVCGIRRKGRTGKPPHGAPQGPRRAAPRPGTASPRS